MKEGYRCLTSVLVCFTVVMSTLVGCSASRTEDARKIEMQEYTLVKESHPQREPDISFLDNWDENSGSMEQYWEKLRQMYILQYLQNPTWISHALRQPIPEKIAEFLYRGYGSSRGYDPHAAFRKELEIGFLYCRLGEEQLLQEQLAILRERAFVRDYHILTYATVWHYCLYSQKERARNLCEETKLVKMLDLHGIDIEEEELLELRRKLR